MAFTAIGKVLCVCLNAVKQGCMIDLQENFAKKFQLQYRFQDCTKGPSYFAAGFLGLRLDMA